MMNMMKPRIATMLTGMVVVTMITGAAMAAEHGQGMQHGKMMQDKQDKSEKMGMQKDTSMMKGRMKSRMMGGMMKRQVVATSDGGVIIVAGNMLLKYDRNLELVKQATIEISDKDMQKMMKKMQKRCKMCRKMMKDKATDTDD